MILYHLPKLCMLFWSMLPPMIVLFIHLMHPSVYGDSTRILYQLSNL